MRRELLDSGNQLEFEISVAHLDFIWLSLHNFPLVGSPSFLYSLAQKRPE